MKEKLLLFITLLICLSVIVIHNVAIHPWMLDDAFISFRYAENFSQGHGFVYNLGERVEGYTNFLWVLLLGLGNIVGINIIIFSKILGFLFSIGCVLLLINSHKFIKNIDRNVSVMSALLFGTCGIFTPWASSGIEVVMFTFFVLLSVLFYISIKNSKGNKFKFFSIGIFCAFSALTRPEGLLIFAIILIDLLIASIKNKNKDFLYMIASFLAIYLPYYFWRYMYYGYLFPNTFYAKVGISIAQISRGIEYLLRFAIPSLFILIPALIGLLTKKWIRKYNRLYLLPFIGVLYVLYIISVGGDSMPAFRFFTPILPLMCIISAMSIPLLFKSKQVSMLVVALIVFYNLIQLRIDREIYRHIANDKVALYGREVGIWLKNNTPNNTIIATNTAGSIPYYSKLKTIDMLGLNDKHIAHRDIKSFGKGSAGHEKGDGVYVLSKKPDYIQFGSSLGSKDPIFLSDRELYNISEFRDQYELKVYNLDSGHELLIYKRKKNIE